VVSVAFGLEHRARRVFIYFVFVALVLGLNFRALAMSAAVQSLTVIPPTSIGFGPSILPTESHV
jgi:hypothetical protein